MSRNKKNTESKGLDLEQKIIKKITKTNRSIRKNRYITQMMREDIINSVSGKNLNKDIPVREDSTFYKSSDY